MTCTKAVFPFEFQFQANNVRRQKKKNCANISFTGGSCRDNLKIVRSLKTSVNIGHNANVNHVYLLTDDYTIKCCCVVKVFYLVW